MWRNCWEFLPIALASRPRRRKAWARTMRQSRTPSCCWRRKTSHGFAVVSSDRLKFSFQFFVPGSGGVDQRAENRSRRLVLIDRSLGMPLHRQDEVIRGCTLERFDDPVLRRAGDGAQSVADNVRGLVMAGIHGDDKCLSLSG